MSATHEAAALARVPDLPQWIDTRGMLLTGRALVTFPPSQRFISDGFVVELASRALLSAIGNPPDEIVAERACAMQGEVNVLCAEDTAETVGVALPSWIRRGVRLLALSGVMPWEHGHDDGDVAIFTRANTPPLEHLPELLRREIGDALEGHPSARFVPGKLPDRSPADASPTPVPIAAVLMDGQPVAFCYPVLQTETLWDVSVETLEGFRGRQLAARAARAMVRHMRGSSKAPVWGALETNAASLSVARQLGFEEAGRLMVFART
jgi:RimJ/RimL family protein N-acetyltransferase